MPHSGCSTLHEVNPNLKKWRNNTGAIAVKLEDAGLIFPSKFDFGSYIVFVAKIDSKKIGALICSVKCLSPEVHLYLSL